MQFTKVQGCGNDFILIDQRDYLNSRDLTANQIRFLCHRSYGIGADGILLITTDHTLKTPCMTIFNADASRAEMCGNGLRCVALYLKRRGMFSNQTALIHTDAGSFELDFSSSQPLERQSPSTMFTSSGVVNQNEWKEVAIYMGWPDQEYIQPVSIDVSVPPKEGTHIDLSCMSWGNPHAVTFDPHAFQNRHHYSSLWQKYFNQGINLSFAHIDTSSQITLHVHERGCGWTQACGTGACATLMAAHRQGLISPFEDITICLPGGHLFMRVDEQKGVIMRGDGVEVFTGKITI